MNHAQLRAFHAVAVEGGFTRAAAKLNPLLALAVPCGDHGQG